MYKRLDWSEQYYSGRNTQTGIAYAIKLAPGHDCLTPAVMCLELIFVISFLKFSIQAKCVREENCRVGLALTLQACGTNRFLTYIDELNSSKFSTSFIDRRRDRKGLFVVVVFFCLFCCFTSQVNS